MKIVKKFSEGEEIPESAKFITCVVENGQTFFAYEVKSQSKKENEEENLSEEERDTIKRSINYLNKKTGGKWTSKNKATIKDIKARLREGADPLDFKKVIDCKLEDWAGNPDMRKYLRPSTLFGNKFYQYLKEHHDKSNDVNPFEHLDKINKGILDEN